MTTSSPISPELAERCSRWEWAQLTVLGLNLAWTTLCLGGYLEQTLVTTSVLNALLLSVYVLGTAGFFRDAEESGATRVKWHPAGWMLLPFLAYAAVNAMWFTPVPWLGWLDWLGWAQMTLIFWVVLNGIRSKQAVRVLIVLLAILGCVLSGLAIYQRFAAPAWLMMGRTQATQFLGRSSGSFGQPNNLAAFLVLVGPAVAAQTFARARTAVSRIIWGYVSAMLAFALVLTISRGAWLALGIALCAAPLVWMRVHPLHRALIAGSITVVLAVAVWGIATNIPAVHERLVELRAHRGELSRPILWRAAWNLFLAHPGTGAGAGSFGVLLDQHRPENFQLEARWAHNEYLNTLSDYGAIGFALAFGGWALIGLRCRRSVPAKTSRDNHDSALTVGLWIGVVAFGMQLTVDADLKTPALGMAFAMVAALLVQRQWPARNNTGAGRSARGGIAFAAIASALAVTATLLWCVPLYRAEALRQKARSKIDAAARLRQDVTEEILNTARADLVTAASLSPANGRVWSDLSYVSGLLVRFHRERISQLGQEAERSSRQAIDCGRPVSEFWVRLGVALDLQGRWMEAGAAFVEALRLAPTRASVWYHQAFHLSLNPVDTNRALGAVALSLRLDPANPEAHSLREQLAARSRAP